MKTQLTQESIAAAGANETPCEFLAMPPHKNYNNGRGGGNETRRNHTCDPVFSISRSAYYKLEKAGHVRFVRLRVPGQQRGKVLIDCASVRRYLEKLSREQNAMPEGGAA